MKKVHLRKAGGTRSACRYSSRPSRQVKLLSVQEFADTPVEFRCSECEDKYQKLCAGLNRKPGIYWILEGDKRVPVEWTGNEWWGIAMQRPYYAEEVIDPVPAHFEDTQRLDWVINHPDAQFDVDEQRLKLSCYVVANLTCGDEHAHGVSGRFLAWGENHRDCIDAFLRGEAKRID